MIEQGLVAYLKADAGLAALIGERLYPIVVIEAPIYPLLTFTRVHSQPRHALDGPQYTTALFQFDAWSTDYGEDKAVLQALRNALDTLHGVTLSDGTRLLSALRGTEADLWGQEATAFRSMVEYELLFVEP